MSPLVVVAGPTYREHSQNRAASGAQLHPQIQPIKYDTTSKITIPKKPLKNCNVCIR